MTRIYQAVAVLVLLFGGFVSYLSLDLSLTADYGPGPGFFSFWLGLFLAFLGLVEVVSVRRAPREPLPDEFIPDRAGVRRVLSIIGALVVALFLLQPLGFTPTMFLFSVFLLRAMGRQAWWATIAIALLGSAGTFYLFRALQVMLPEGPLGF